MGKFKLNYRALILACMAGLFFAGCNKSELLHTIDYHTLKVYRDSAISGDNPSFNMTAGKDRIFITYGHKYFFIGANGQYDYTDIQPVIMAVDNSGNFLWKTLLPVAFEECAIADLDDGGCVVLSQTGFSSNPAYSRRSLYMFRISAEGKHVQTDSFTLKDHITTSTTNSNYLNFIRTSEGRILFYGDYWGRDGGYTTGFMLEYSPLTGVSWFKEYRMPMGGFDKHDVILHECVETDDNALLFCGSRMYYDFANNINVVNLLAIKTTLSGDTIWCRKYSGGSSYLKGCITKTTRGTYILSHNLMEGNLLEISSTGDSLGSVKLGKNQFVSGLQPTKDGGFLALVNNSPYGMFQAGFDPRYYQENTFRIQFDAGLKMVSQKPFQTRTSDFLPVACRTSRGDLACFGMIHSIGKTYYLPHLYLLK